MAIDVVETPRYDLIMRGGQVLDGSGAEATRADIGVLDDRIVAVGDLARAEAPRIIEAQGLHVAPGFIDIHTHSDISATYDPGQASAIAMGVTTQVVGNCGLSLGFGRNTEVFAFEQRWLAPHRARIVWDNFDEHLRLVEDHGVATNYVPLAGHGTLRKRVIGVQEQKASGEDLEAMRRDLEAALASGAWGLSSGLEYPPSAYADVAELTDLCRVVRDYGGLYATHLRNEGDTLVEAVQEAIEVAERAGVALQLSHHKAEGIRNWGKVHTTLAMVRTARLRGLDVQLDQYPYTAFMTSLAIQLLPRYALRGSNEEVAARLTDVTFRSGARAAMLAVHPEWDDLSSASPWYSIQIGVCRGMPELQGRTLFDLAAEKRIHPIEFAFDLLAATEGYVSAVNFAIGESDIADVMRFAYTSIGSDGVGTHPDGTAGNDRIHPRTYGTFARVLGRYVRALGVLSEAQAIHKMTGLPAARMGLRDRGLIQVGAFADLVAYDPDRIEDRATFDEPHRFATGIHTVVVNGRPALEEGKLTGSIAGRVLRKTA